MGRVTWMGMSQEVTETYTWYLKKYATSRTVSSPVKRLIAYS